MDYTELIAKQGVLADIYNKQRRDYKLAKNREEKQRVKDKRKEYKLLTIIKKN